jgi:trans-aconitate methyltransferase
MAHEHTSHGHTSHDHTGHEHLAEILDLDAEVLDDLHREVTAWVTAQVPGAARIIDLGAGTGNGALALAVQLPRAEVIAVDTDAEMIDRIQHKAQALGIAGRVRTIQADLDQPWPAIGEADLVWAANSLHHMGDPGRAVAQIFAVLRPGGLLAVTELDSFPRFLTDPAGAAVEDRVHAAMAQARDEAGMHMHEDWPARMAEAGFEVEAERRFDVDLHPPLPGSASRYAQLTFQRARHGLDGRLGAADLAAIDAIAAAIPDRDDLTVRTSRTVWLARRPVSTGDCE